jgi:hypothetical protein
MSLTYMVKLNSTELNDMLKGYTVERNKLWTEADRNLDGELKATFIGVFPKITLEFGYLTESTLKTVLGILEEPSFNVSWWDSEKGDYSTGTYYAGDFKYGLFDKADGRYEPWSVNLIPYTKL